jgi:DHA1 family tetracycline resistance protein-like MFS transporter
VKKSPLFIIFTTIFIDLVGFGIVLPVLPLYAQTFGASPLTIGVIVASFSLMQFFFMPIWGRVSDRYGRRPVILWSLVASALSYVIYGFAHSLTLLILSRIFAGIAGATVSTAQAYIADITTPENRAKGMGLIGAAFGLGFIFGPVIGGVLSESGHVLQHIAGMLHGGFFDGFARWLDIQSNAIGLDVRFDIPALFAATLCLANAILAYFRLPESLHPDSRSHAAIRIVSRKSFFHALSTPYLGILLVVLFLMTFSHANIYGTLPLFTSQTMQLSALENGYLFALMGFFGTIMQGGLIGRLTKMFGERRLLLIGCVSMVAGFLVLALSSTVLMLVLSILFLSAGTGLCNPVIPSLITHESNPREHGTILGISQSFSSLGRVLGPSWGGLVYDRLGHQWPFFTAAMFMIVASFFSFRIMRHRKEIIQE